MTLGSAIILLAPNALGPNSILPCIHPIAFPSITHVDYSARIQTVHKDLNAKYHYLLIKFYERTGCPILINTSFNVRGEPIVCSPSDAFKCFMTTDLDILIIENFILYKDKQFTLKSKKPDTRFKLD